MNFDLAKIILFIIVAFILIKSVKNAMEDRDLEEVIIAIIGNISSIASFFIMITFYSDIDEKIEKFLLKVNYNKPLSGLISVMMLFIMFFIVKAIVYLVLRCINCFFNVKRGINKSFLFIFSTLLGFVRGLLVVVCILIAIITYNEFVMPAHEVNTFSNLNVYNNLVDILYDQKLDKIKNGIVEDISSSTVIYYNGVTLEEGIKSNKKIDEKAKEITHEDKTDREKAKSLYNWIGHNVKYDYNKAYIVMNKNNVKNSGAIPAFNERKGICFDYACLYVAMCRAINLDVRIIMGDAYNGEEYISHAWNEVYLKDEEKWIKVDPTFYIAGNYFDNKDFNKDHKKRSTAGQW